MKLRTLFTLGLLILMALGCQPATTPTPIPTAVLPTRAATAAPSPTTTATATVTIVPTRTPFKIPTPMAQFPTATPFPPIARNQSLVYLGGEGSNPRSYDPATTSSAGNKLIFSGLAAFDPQMKLIPDLAESWQTNDGMTYVFKLRRNARFHNGRPVIAQDVIYSWERAANPKTDSNTVLTYLGDIVGVKQMREGKADYISGLKAIDDYTLQVTVDAPKPYFLLKLTYATAFIVDRENVESGPEWYRTPNGTGPYRMIRWDRQQQIVYERNDDFYLDPPAIRYVVVRINAGIGIRMYETGEIDVTSISTSDLARVRDPKSPLNPDLISAVTPCTSYVNLDVKQPPFDDLKVRQAFVLATDQQRYVDTVLSGNGVIAKGLVPPAMPGFNAQLKGQQFDPARAKQLLAETKYSAPGAMPKIVYTASGTGSSIASGVTALIQMWQQNLGVSISVENIDPAKYQDEVNAGHHGQIVGNGWCADYLDPENFADALFHTGTPINRSNYSNPKLDALLEQARVEQDGAKRIQMYQTAEQMILDDAPAVFTVHGQSNTLIKPHVSGYVITPVSIAIERWLKFK